MNTKPYHSWNRREFLTRLAAAGAAGLTGLYGPLVAAEGPPETTTIRLSFNTADCLSPLNIADAFLRIEGFTEIQHVKAAGGFSAPQMIANGEVDIASSFVGSVVYHLGAGLPITALGGLHVGCYELFAREPIHGIGDLKGRRVGIQTLSSSGHLYVSIMAKHVGLDPSEDIEWVTSPDGDAMERFAAGETDAFLGFAPEPQELRDRGISRVIINTLTDKPWSNYFCCMIYGNRAWAHNHPVATKRCLRAIFKAAEFCQAEPEKAARQLVDGGFSKRYDYTQQTIQEMPYDLWHEYDSEDTIRFYALRLYESEMLGSTPEAIISEGTDWRFFNELKRELKA